MSVYLGDPREHAGTDDIYTLMAQDLDVRGWHKRQILGVYGFMSGMMIGRNESVNDDRLRDWMHSFSKDDLK